MPDIKLSLVNQALTATGNGAVTSLTGNDVLLVALAQHYDDMVAEELEESGAYFAMKTATPTLLTPKSADPLPHQWQMPSDLLTLRAVLYKGVELDGIRFSIEGRVVRVAYDTDVTFRYLWRPLEENWPRRFRRIVEQRIEALFLRVTERFREAEGRDADTEIKTIKARYAEAGQRRNRPQHPGTIANARRGLGGSAR